MVLGDLPCLIEPEWKEKLDAENGVMKPNG